MPDIEALKPVLDAISALESKTPTPEAIEGMVKRLLAEKLAEPATVHRTHLATAPADPLAGSKFGRLGLKVADVEFAHDIVTALHAIRPGDSQPPSETLRNAYTAVRKAMDTAESGYGSQLIGAQYIAELWEQVRLTNKIFPLFQFIPMTAPVAYSPIDGALPEMLYVGESTANNSSNYGTSKTASNRATLTAAKFVIHQMWSGEMEEDSIIPFVPFLRNQLNKAVGYYTDSLLLNGDTETGGTGNINNDDGAPTSTKHYLAFNGLRKLPLVTNTDNASDIAAAWTASKFLTLLKLMGVWGVPGNPADVVFIMSMSDYLCCVDLDEVATMDKIGPRATILTGQLGEAYGHPVVVSEAMALTETDGKVNTAGGGTKGQILAVNRGGWLGGTRREGKIEFERIPATDQSRLVFSTRLAFTNFSTDVSAVGYDITV
uniref:Putative capsid protein n=1 Tax=viral metagenome TaxID=1070528 RepID=A0A6M3IH65_9ZZZZ